MAELNPTTIFLALVVILAACLIARKISSLRKLPPGPWGLPFLGSMPHLLMNNTFGEFEKYRQKYGNVFSVGLGNFNVVVINGHKLIHDAFRRDELLGRPDFEVWQLKNMGVKNRGILFCDGNSTWNEQRRFALRNLRDFGIGKDSMEGLLLHELKELLNHLKKDVGKPVTMKNLFNASVLNSLWYILTGNRFELDDPLFIKIISLLTSNLKEALIASPAFFYTWPAKYNLLSRGKWARIAENRNTILNFIQQEINKHGHGEGDSNDFIDVYFNQSKQCEDNKDKTSSFYGEEGAKNLIVTLHDLFIAGTETTSTTLLWALLFLAMDASVQEKLFQEVDSVVGKGRMPSREDKPNMPYTEAVLNEVHRHGSLVPMSVYHKVLEDTKLEGHALPKGTVIFANLYGAHHDKDYWKDPENFRPERFLDASGKKLVKHEALMPFSSGKRQCLGETLARDTLFLFLTGFVQQFSFEMVPGSTSFDPKDLPTTCSFILQPEPFQIILRNRL